MLFQAMTVAELKQAQLSEAADSYSNIVQQVRKADPFLALVVKVVTAAIDSGHTNGHLWCSTSSAYITLYLDKSARFTDLAPLFEALAAQGVEPTSSTDTPSPDRAERIFEFVLPAIGANYPCRLSLTAVIAQGENCRVVQTGEKEELRKIPILQIVCDD